MRIESSVTSLSWIPSEAVTGLNKAVFGSGFTHYDDPPPDVIRDLEALRATPTGSGSPTTSSDGSSSTANGSSTPATAVAASWEPPPSPSGASKRASPPSASTTSSGTSS